ncbi:MAG: 2-succinyl-5-enolpyruvyl-6-hydroxy-3-cyclohexene-1-carboxylic-acid synthase [Flavobacteriaceae bacterium]|nr:2-succinyl-5-enolpyruvyl-6-hydroxy-3-cyclohexene-1-carboxylic-acid synthase [Flavobacteriaceae bacterium]
MKWPKHDLAQFIIQLCESKGVKHVVISPGSRNAPLTIGFTHHDFFKCYSIVDERSAGFFALGIAQQTSEPVAVVCTSGSALLNYYPAVAEAFYSGLPLVVISADRPQHLVNIGDGQTIIQPHAFGKHILFEANLIPPVKTLFSGVMKAQQKAQQLISKALDTAQQKMGPVHINVPFDEPLYQTVDQPIKIHISSKTVANEDNVVLNSSVLKTWQKAKRKLILVGVNPPNSLASSVLEQLANDPSVLVLTETTSNLHHPNFFPFIDQLIAPLNASEFEALQPDLLLTFGGLIISKKIKAFLRNYKPNHHWHVHPYRANDTFFSLNKHFKCTPNTFFNQLLKKTSHSQSTYFDDWNTVKHHRRKGHERYLQSMPFSDFKAFELISAAIPQQYMVQSGNSSAIRYLQLFEFHPSIELYCNRGTSGIDGSTSTAVGASVVSNCPTLLITGDLSFFYDINGLWNTSIPDDFKIIVINNGGGGIFRILPGNDNSALFETYFETKHQRSAKTIAEDFGFSYTMANSTATLTEVLTTFFDTAEGPKLLEIFTPSSENDKILLSYFDEIV